MRNEMGNTKRKIRKSMEERMVRKDGGKGWEERF